MLRDIKDLYWQLGGRAKKGDRPLTNFLKKNYNKIIIIFYNYNKIIKNGIKIKFLFHFSHLK